MEGEHNPKALAMADSLFPGVGRRRMQILAELDPEYLRLFEDYIYGGLYSRDVLDQRTRELCAVAAIAVLNFPNQLASHIKAALLAGATRDEVKEVLMQMSVYAGWPASLTALDHMRQVYAELDTPE
ncbi:MAG: carboxymuconolactone decarboxylase family protein [Chloroflexota bacterium]